MRHFRPNSLPASPRRRLVLAAFVALTAAVALVPWKVVARQQALQAEEEISASLGPAAGAPAPDDPSDSRESDPQARLKDSTFKSFLRSREAELSPSADGLVVEVAAPQGETVKAGQLLIRLDDGRARAELEMAQAELELAKVQLKRKHELFERKNATTLEVQEAESYVRQLQARLDVKKHEVEHTRVLVPFDGVLEKVAVQRGEFVTKGTPLASLVDLDSLWADVPVPAELARRLKKGDKVELTTGGPRGQTFQARVAYISSRVQAGSQTVVVRAVLEKPDNRLKPGTEVHARFDVEE